MKGPVIYTPGRTGSMMICHALIERYKLPTDYLNSVASAARYKNGIIHCHNPLFVPPDAEERVAIVSKRDAAFDCVCSHLIFERTREQYKYTNKKIQPFNVSEEELTNKVLWNRAFYHILDLSRFQKAFTVKYEDIIKDPYYLFSLFGEHKEMSHSLVKSPYRAEDLIENYDFCKKLFDKLNSQPLTETDINNVKNPILNKL